MNKLPVTTYSQESGWKELKSDASGRHLQQGEHLLEQNPESAFNDEQKHNQESSTTAQIHQQLCSGQAQEVQLLPKYQNKERSALPQIQQQLCSGQAQEVQQMQKHQSHTLHPVVSKEVQIIESKIPQNQDLQYPENQKPQTDESQELQTQQLQAQTHSSQLLQRQQTSNPVQVAQPLSAPEESQEKQSTEHQKQTKNCQHAEKGSQQWHQEQHLKKQKKKLVGENQERLNYLVQASKAIALLARPGPSTAFHSQRALAAQIGSLAGAVSRRCVQRLAPSLKRCLCKGCGTALVYGVNAKVRHRSRRQKHLVVTCLTCHTIKRFLNNPRHQLWLEQEEAVV